MRGGPLSGSYRTNPDRYSGMYVNYKIPLVFRAKEPAAEGIIPEPVRLGDYRFTFKSKIFGGFLCDIEGYGDTRLVTGVRVTRFMDKVVRDDDKRVTVGLMLFGPPVINIWAFRYHTSSGYSVS